MAEEDWCSVSEAARRLGVTPTAIRNRIKRGTLEHRPNGNMGKLVRVPLTVPVTVTPTVPLTVPEPLGGTVPLTVPPPEEPPAADGTIKAMEAHIKTLRELLDQQRADHAAELERLHVLLQQEQQQVKALTDQRERVPLWDRLWQRLTDRTRP